jgi:hypothetical protein
MDFLNRTLRLRTEAEIYVRNKVKGAKTPLPSALDIELEEHNPIKELDEKALYGEDGKRFLYMDLSCEELMLLADHL